MAKEKQADDSVLVSAAKAVGGAAGTLASLAGAAPEKTPAPRVRAATRAGRIPPSNKTRLPRRAKKKLQMTALKQARKKAA